MLKSVDILIGFSVIMLVVSMGVTLIIQWLMHFLEMRGKQLLAGLTTLLHQIDPEFLTPENAQQIATRILTHPMLAGSGEKLAEVVQREELIKIVLQIAAPAAAQLSKQVSGDTASAVASVGALPAGNAQPPGNDSPGSSPATAEQALAMALRKLGIPDPGSTLNAVRMVSMRLEASRPELATHVREAMAMITEAESQFVAKVNGWFDQTMDRVSQSFTNHSRYWTAGVSLVLALLLQIDAVKIVNRLAMDDSLRASLVQQAQQTSPPEAPTADTLEKASQENVKQLQLLATEKLITWPTWPIWKTWRQGWDQSSVFGVLLSAMLLSFGAPFWFNVLGDLLKLRPALASKDDAQRVQRETSQTEVAGGVPPPSPLPVARASAGGEAGALPAG